MASDFFCDSFDHYVTADIGSKWTRLSGTPTIVASSGRRSTSCLRFTAVSGAVHKGLTSSTTAVIRFAVKVSSLTFRVFLCEFQDAVNTHVLFTIETDGSLKAWLGSGAGDYCGSGSAPSGALGASAAGLINTGSYYHLELKVTVNNTTGVVEARVNGTAVIDLSNQDTQNAGTTAITQIGLGGATLANTDIDDVMITWNSSTFLGDVRVDVLYPTAEGNSSAWTPSTGTDNSANIDETAPNSDTDYNSSAGTDTDTHVTQNVPSGASVKGVQVCQYSKKTDAAACSVAPVIRHSGTDYAGDAVALSTTYGFQTQGYLTNPGTAIAWTETEVNNAEFGYKRTV